MVKQSDKLIRENYTLETRCRMVFNEKGEKVQGGTGYLVIETLRGKAIIDIPQIEKLVKDLANYIPKKK